MAEKMNVTQKLIASHLVEGKMEPGEEIGIRIDQTLTQGNLPESPDFWLSSAAISYESEKWATLLQGFTGTGDAAGQFVTPVLESIDLKGWSLFTELKPFQVPISLTFRADELVNRSTNSWEQRQGVAGIAYRFENGSKLIVDVNRTWENSTSIEFTRFEVITEVRF